MLSWTPRSPFPELGSALACFGLGSHSVLWHSLARVGSMGLSLSLTFPCRGPQLNLSTTIMLVKCVRGMNKPALHTADGKLRAGLLSWLWRFPVSAQLGTD